MTLTLILFCGFVAILLLGLGWALWEPRERRKLQADPRSLGGSWPAPRNLFAADPASTRKDRRRIPLEEGLA